jgi:hypothetical protein
MKQLIIMVGETTADTVIYVEGQPIGWVQEVKLHVAVDSSPTVEVVFPDLRKFSGDAATKVAEQVALFEGMPNVKITLKPVEFPKQ